MSDTHVPSGLSQDVVGEIVRERAEALAERDRYREQLEDRTQDVQIERNENERLRKVLRRIGRVHGEWRAVVADALGCSIEDLIPKAGKR